MARQIRETTIISEDTVQAPTPVHTHRVATTPTPAVHDRNVWATYSTFDQAIYFIFGTIEILLLIRFLFRMSGANPFTPAVAFIYALTDIFMAPFAFIFPTNAAAGVVFEWSILAAMAMYAFLAWILTKLVRIFYTQDLKY